MEKYNKTSLCSAVYDIVQALMNDENNQLTKTSFTHNFSNFVINRIRIILDRTKYFYIEIDYNETEWKDMIALHYVHTSYNHRNNVMRIHFFNNDNMTSESYLGFVTLRYINEVRSMLSFIYPNLKNINFKNDVYFIGYEKYVHINNIELFLYTYPCMVQDGVVASCTHVNLLTMAKYLHNTRGTKNITLSEIERDYQYRKAKQYPTYGLMYTQILEIFHNNRIPINNFVLLQKEKEDIDSLEYCIHVYIESGIPVMLFTKGHALQIIGHSFEDSRYKYLIYDESGVLLKEIFDDNAFMEFVEWQDIEKILESEDFIIAPEHEKIFMSCQHFLKLFKQCIADKRLKPILLNAINCDENIDITTDVLKNKFRILFVDNVSFKNFLSAHISAFKGEEDKCQSELERICSLSRPHYYWYCELQVSPDNYLCFIADPTYSPYTTSNIFINRIPLYVDTQLSLLTSKDDFVS